MTHSSRKYSAFNNKNLNTWAKTANYALLICSYFSLLLTFSFSFEVQKKILGRLVSCRTYTYTCMCKWWRMHERVGLKLTNPSKTCFIEARATNKARGCWYWKHVCDTACLHSDITSHLCCSVYVHADLYNDYS